MNARQLPPVPTIPVFRQNIPISDIVSPLGLFPNLRFQIWYQLPVLRSLLDCSVRTNVNALETFGLSEGGDFLQQLCRYLSSPELNQHRPCCIDLLSPDSWSLKLGFLVQFGENLTNSRRYMFWLFLGESEYYNITWAAIYFSNSPDRLLYCCRTDLRLDRRRRLDSPTV